MYNHSIFNPIRTISKKEMKGQLLLYGSTFTELLVSYFSIWDIGSGKFMMVYCCQLPNGDASFVSNLQIITHMHLSGQNDMNVSCMVDKK